MSGMAIILLCAFQVDDSGWRFSQTTFNPSSSATSVQPVSGPNDRGATGELMERAQRR